MPHPDEGLIHAWLDGELDADEAARVESLVASDPVWAAAAAEARGLVAASTRIVGALDYTPGNVIPKRRAAPRGAPWWAVRAAAALLMVAGGVAVWQRGEPDLSSDSAAFAPPVAQVAPALPVPPQAPAAVAARAAEGGSMAAGGAGGAGGAGAGGGSIAGSAAVGEMRKADVRVADAPAGAPPLAEADAREEAIARVVAGAATGAAGASAPVVAALADLDAASARGDTASAAKAQSAAVPDRQTAERTRDAPLPASLRANAAPAAAFQATTTLCFASPVTGAPTRPVLRISEAALADSVRRGVLARRGDTLVAQPARVIGVAIACPVP